jgi:hypothetical protein
MSLVPSITITHLGEGEVLQGGMRANPKFSILNSVHICVKDRLTPVQRSENLTTHSTELTATWKDCLMLGRTSISNQLRRDA